MSIVVYLLIVHCISWWVLGFSLYYHIPDVFDPDRFSDKHPFLFGLRTGYAIGMMPTMTPVVILAIAWLVHREGPPG